MYGTVYEDCVQAGPECTPPCGYTPNTFSLYTSPDLVNWTFVTADILPAMKADNTHVDYWMVGCGCIWAIMSLERTPLTWLLANHGDWPCVMKPNVAFNAQTRTYVMQYWSSTCG